MVAAKPKCIEQNFLPTKRPNFFCLRYLTYLSSLFKDEQRREYRMDSKKAAQVLDRINALHRSLHLLGDEQDISAIERDLMLSYLRQLYALYLEDSKTVQALSTPPATPVIADEPPVLAPIKETSWPTAAPPAVPLPAPPPRLVSTAVPAVVPAVVSPPTPVPAADPPPIRPAALATPLGYRSKHPKVEQLFAKPAAMELSDRLALQPVKDLTRALTINNRVQYANTLFGGNSELMNSVLIRLDTLNEMAAARPYLEELADQFHWMEDEKLVIAIDFVKLVSRRYA